MAFCAICGRDHPVGPCAGNPIELRVGSERRRGRRFQPELEKTVKKTERFILLVAVAVVAVVAAVVVYALIT